MAEPIDMITAIQVEDAVKTRELVEARVKAVALKIVELQGLAQHGREGFRWQLSSWRIDLKDSYPKGMEHRARLQVHATLTLYTTDFRGIPTLEDLVSDDLFDDERRDYLTRSVDFPRRWLYDDSWWAEAEEAARIVHRRMAGYHAEQLVKSIAGAEERLAGLREKRGAYLAEAGEGS